MELDPKELGETLLQELPSKETTPGRKDPEKGHNKTKKKAKKEKKKKTEKKKSKSIPICGILKMRYYQQYFESTTDEVTQKLFWSVFWFTGKFNSVDPEKTDLYGPIWILCTMVLSLTFSQNIYSYLIRPDVYYRLMDRVKNSRIPLAMCRMRSA